MKDVPLLVWLAQLGLSVVVPLVGFLVLAVWLRQEQGWGVWVLWVGIGLGILMAIDGFLNSLKLLKKLGTKKEQEPPSLSFNDHE